MFVSRLSECGCNSFILCFHSRKVRKQEELLNIYLVCIHNLGITPHLTIIITLQLKYCCVYFEDKEVSMQILVVWLVDDEPSTWTVHVLSIIHPIPVMANDILWAVIRQFFCFRWTVFINNTRLSLQKCLCLNDFKEKCKVVTFWIVP